MDLLYRFLLPATLIVINDIAAYIFGFFFGRTPLIKLSPKKTWEGFIGASITTIISAFVVSKLQFVNGDATVRMFFFFFFLEWGGGVWKESLDGVIYYYYCRIITWLQLPKTSLIRLMATKFFFKSLYNNQVIPN